MCIKVLYSDRFRKEKFPKGGECYRTSDLVSIFWRRERQTKRTTQQHIGLYGVYGIWDPVYAIFYAKIYFHIVPNPTKIPFVPDMYKVWDFIHIGIFYKNFYVHFHHCSQNSLYLFRLIDHCASPLSMMQHVETKRTCIVLSGPTPLWTARRLDRFLYGRPGIIVSYPQALR